MIIPNWPAAHHIHAFTTTRREGNLAIHVGDDPAIVQNNREHLIQTAALPSLPYWLNQTHSDRVVIAQSVSGVPDADGSYTHEKNIVCAVLTADCLPILICDKNGQEIAALHAGWRGLLGHIIARGVACFSAAPKDLLVWLGPAIGPQAFEVGPEVYQAFTEQKSDFKKAFMPSIKPEHYMLDIYALAKQYLSDCGVQAVYGGEYCTYTDANDFYSYRREQQTGRMATMIWRA